MRRQTRGMTAIGMSVAAASVLAVPLFANAGGGSRDTGHPKHPHTASTVKLDILAINDFHGQLEQLDPARTSSGRINQTPAGGAEYLATQPASDTEVLGVNSKADLAAVERIASDRVSDRGQVRAHLMPECTRGADL